MFVVLIVVRHVAGLFGLLIIWFCFCWIELRVWFGVLGLDCYVFVGCVCYVCCSWLQIVYLLWLVGVCRFCGIVCFVAWYFV